jgi:histone H3/H4
MPFRWLFFRLGYDSASGPCSPLWRRISSPLTLRERSACMAARTSYDWRRFLAPRRAPSDCLADPTIDITPMSSRSAPKPSSPRAVRSAPPATRASRASEDKPDLCDANIRNFAPVARIMKTALPENAKIAKEAKECMQECVSEFISFITSEGESKTLSWCLPITLFEASGSNLSNVQPPKSATRRSERRLTARTFSLR